MKKQEGVAKTQNSVAKLSTSKTGKLSTSNWIVKSNVLNEVRHSKMNISQIRLFSIYLSKINPYDVGSREVEFNLDEYTKIMQFKQTNITRLMSAADDLLRLTITFLGADNEKGLREFAKCQLFKRFELQQNDNGEWIARIDCHDDVLHLMFELKSHFFKYKLWNALQLSSPNQQRMYEILKQYEYVGAREISVGDLREFLGLKKDEYPRWDNFKTRILDASQEALARHTDIKFTWEVAGKRGKGGKINALKFNIEKNDGFARQLTFEEFLLEQPAPGMGGDEKEFAPPDDNLAMMGEACDNEFSPEEIRVLYDMMLKIVPYSPDGDWALKMYHYLMRKYNQLNWRATGSSIRFRYLKKLVELDLDDVEQNLA